MKITEVQAADGFINRGLSQEVVIEPNKPIEMVLNNKPQMGQLKLKKLGKQPTELTSVNSEYGQIPLENVAFDLKAAEDIMVGGTKRHSKGDIVATVTTNKDGIVAITILSAIGNKIDIVGETKSQFFYKERLDFIKELVSFEERRNPLLLVS